MNKLSMEVTLKQYCTGCGIIFMCKSQGTSFQDSGVGDMLNRIKAQYESIKNFDCPRCKERLEEVHFYEDHESLGRQWTMKKKKAK